MIPKEVCGIGIIIVAVIAIIWIIAFSASGTETAGTVSHAFVGIFIALTATTFVAGYFE